MGIGQEGALFGSHRGDISHSTMETHLKQFSRRVPGVIRRLGPRRVNLASRCTACVSGRCSGEYLVDACVMVPSVLLDLTFSGCNYRFFSASTYTFTNFVLRSEITTRPNHQARSYTGRMSGVFGSKGDIGQSLLLSKLPHGEFWEIL
jgi:hypothetical protein